MNAFTQSIRLLLQEAYVGRRSPPTWFTDPGEHSGILGTLEALSAEDASHAPHGGSSIAAHINHLRWSLAMANALMRGEQPAGDWAQSWTRQALDEPTWATLRADLERGYETLLGALPNGADPDDPVIVQSGVALVAHAAYHLGALRQMVLALRAG